MWGCGWCQDGDGQFIGRSKGALGAHLMLEHTERFFTEHREKMGWNDSYRKAMISPGS